MVHQTLFRASLPSSTLSKHDRWVAERGGDDGEQLIQVPVVASVLLVRLVIHELLKITFIVQNDVQRHSK